MPKPKKSKTTQKNKIPMPPTAPLSRKIIIAVIAGALVLAGLVLARNYLCRSDKFRIEEVTLKGEGLTGSFLAGKLKDVGVGENIFSINIRHLGQKIKQDYFDVKHIRIQRVFPNKLIFFIQTRKPVAYIKETYFYPVDAEGFILREVSSSLTEPLPVIEGIHVSRRYVGKRMNSPRLVKALELLGELRRSNIFDSYHVANIDAPSSRNLSFYIDDGLQVKIGGEQFRRRLALLKKTLSDAQLDLRTIDYIDLRFKDVIIGPK